MGKNDKNAEKKSDLFIIAKSMSMIFQISLSMMVPICLCLFAGIKLDRHFGTSYLTIIFLFLGFAAGIRSVYTLTKNFYADSLKKENEEQKYYNELYESRNKTLGGNDEGNKADIS